MRARLSPVAAISKGWKVNSAAWPRPITAQAATSVSNSRGEENGNTMMPHHSSRAWIVG